ncbi:metallophosphoesterase family protein [Natronomonas sp.]|uniref:metallophosphoesterase family protein n=1 Tax=Natronomonas sp. TaxID=2184060 RepID=UPI002616E6DD|nr:metallophosphoesterase family protein [Natronomonas sp.]
MEVVIVSDTHVKSRAASLPAWVEASIEAADHAVHAGDFDSRPAYERIDALAEGLTAVGGNMDRALGLPAVARVDLGGVRFVVTHGDGDEGDYESRLLGAVEANVAGEEAVPTVGVGGHTHRVLDAERGGYRLLNPGSATGAWPAQRATLIEATARDGTLSVAVRSGEG